MTTIPIVIEETNLSNAWIKVLKHIIDNPGKEICPLVLTITHFEEINEIRTFLDSHLKENDKASIQTVSETIFPESLYKYCDYNKDDLFEEYKRNLPRIKKIDASNGRGTYFERLIAYKGTDETINQLDIIINALKQTSNRRRSKFQASIFDPRKDHTNRPYQSFPCLQHVTFFEAANGDLILNSFYAIQYLYERAYGNWLGLINLGKFMANELSVNLERFNCFVGAELLDHLSKEEAKNLLEEIEQEIA